MAWTGAFVVERFFKSGESVIATQNAFYAHLMLIQNNAVLYKKSIFLRVENSVWNSIILM